jgi:hypothetical protein
MAVTKAWNEPFWGAQPRSPAQRASVSPKTLSGQLGGVDEVRVDDEVARAPGDARSRGRPASGSAGRRASSTSSGSDRESAGGLQCTERTGVLTPVHVGGRAVTLLEDLDRELGGVAVADLDRDAGRGGELARR